MRVRPALGLSLSALACALFGCHQALQVREPTPGDDFALQVRVDGQLPARHMEVRLRVDEEQRTALLSPDGRWISTFVEGGYHQVGMLIFGSERKVTTRIVEVCRPDLIFGSGAVREPLQGGCVNRDTKIEQGLETEDVLLCDMGARVHVSRDTPLRMHVDVGADGRCSYACSPETQCTFVRM